ncbi:MAG TPA: protease pro-enzyme activation domain-containing protein, partial [Pirellulales bacterium]|nr:protease pro-enzyme activation domain-containing protein [Pirellulales bacterium]
MSLPPNHVSLPGSHREPFQSACSAGARSGDERLEVTVVLKSPQSTANEELLAAQPADRSTARPAPISRAEFAKTYGARVEDVEKVEEFAAEHHLTVVRSDSVRRSVMLSGTVAQFNAAFGVSLEHFEYDGGTYRGRTGPVTVPTEVADVVEAVLGLDDRPQAVTHLRQHAGPRSLSPLDVARLYNVPPKLDGSGQCLALIELEGGYRPADLSTYFHQLGISPAPIVKAISVDGAKNAPTGNPDGPDGEVMLDIEIAGAVAPRATIAVYFAPNTDRGFLDAITKATHDAQLNPAV